MVVFSSYAIQAIMSFLMLAMTFMTFPRAQISAKRINEVLEEFYDFFGYDIIPIAIILFLFLCRNT